MEPSSEKVLPFNDPVMLAKLEEIKRYPELIVKVGEWRSISICYYCLGEIPNNYACLRSWVSFETPNHKDNINHLCPHCKKNPIYKALTKVSKDYKKGYRWSFKQLKHYIVRKRDIITGYTETGWIFKEKHPIIFVETVLVEDNSK